MIFLVPLPLALLLFVLTFTAAYFFDQIGL